MRRWIPAPARRAAAPALPSLGPISDRDLAFCTEFAARGGVAVSDQGFEAETELTRMQRAGLLVLERETTPPFAVTKVSLSSAMREALSERKSDSDVGTPSPRVNLADRDHCRKGFEVARGMISAALKAEFSRPSGQSSGDLERRIMSRISTLQDPFGP